MILIKSDDEPHGLAKKEFEADVLLLCSQRRSSFSGTLSSSPGRQLSKSCPSDTIKVFGTIHVGVIRQAAQVHLVPGRLGQRVRVRIQLVKMREYIRPGMRVMFRESGGAGGIKFVGRAVE
jgi:hypothetical protein